MYGQSLSIGLQNQYARPFKILWIVFQLGCFRDSGEYFWDCDTVCGKLVITVFRNPDFAKCPTCK
jgi:hypothetical protein